jgi:glycosyltransferase involved in cell wall biosynthesis
VQEAMSYALPVIVGEADGTQSNLVRSDNGWVMQHGNAEELADILREALRDIANLRKKGSASYAIVRDEVNLEAMVRAFEQAIITVMKDR